MNSKSSHSGLRLRLMVVGIPVYSINPFADLIGKWIQCSGEEWTVNRLKNLKTYLIHQYTGQAFDYSLAKNRHGEVKGIVGSLMRFALRSPGNFSKVINAFMAYSHWVSETLTKSQRMKFLDAVSAPSVIVTDGLANALERTTQVIVGSHKVTGTPSCLIEWMGSPTKRSPTALNKSVPQNSSISSELLLLDNEETWQHVKGLWTEIYSHVFKGYDVHRFVDDAHYDTVDHGSMVAGEVHFLQEPGYKLRSIASPYRMFQVASEPLKNTLKGIVAQLEWDCTHDQARAYPYVQEALSQHKMVHSVDLSSATDMFPLSLQTIVLKTIFGNEDPYVKLFETVSRADWRSELGLIRWNKGQPLGFNPSFFAFTLTHGLLLRTLLNERWNGQFFVVGDDVLILDDRLYHRYISTLSQLGCPYSTTKSINSCELAEFAGKLILSNMVIPQLKWRSVSDDNFLDLARVVGRRLRLILSKRQNEVLNFFAHVPDFIHPLGLNWSFPGSNLENMIEKGLQIAVKESVLNSLTGLSGRINRQLYADYGPHTQDLSRYIQKDVVAEGIRAFDEKVIAVFRSLGFARFRNEYFLEGLRDIPRASSNDELPLETKEPGRVSLLRRLFRMFSNSTT